MPVFFQPVQMPQLCFLSEALLWVAFQRLPIARYNDDNIEIREATENEGYEINTPDGPLAEEECKRGGLPPDPHYLRLLEEDSPYFKTYDQLEPEHGHNEALRLIQEAFQKDRDEYAQRCALWQPYYDQAIEYPASQIFVALKDGRLRARGRPLPLLDPEEALELLKEDDRYVGDLPFIDIPSSFWTLKGINFEGSAAKNLKEHYCHVMVWAEDMLAIFPGERENLTVERIGDTLVVNEGESHKQLLRSVRGRPSYPWERFHLEVSALVHQNELPAKKEAAIQHFQSWFERELDVRPSRAAIGEKLTPYYERFLRGRGQKT